MYFCCFYVRFVWTLSQKCPIPDHFENPSVSVREGFFYDVAMIETITTVPGSLPVLSPIEQYICRYIIQNSEQAVNMPIRHLAEAACVSTTSVLRLVRKFGYEGYSDFRSHLLCDPSSSHVFDADEREFELNTFFEITARTPVFEKSMEQAAVILSRSREILFAADSYGRCACDAGLHLFSKGNRQTHLLSEVPEIRERKRGSCAIVIIGSSSENEISRLQSLLPVGKIPLIIIYCGGCPLKLPGNLIDCTGSRQRHNASSLIPAVHILEELRKRANILS